VSTLLCTPALKPRATGAGPQVLVAPGTNAGEVDAAVDAAPATALPPLLTNPNAGADTNGADAVAVGAFPLLLASPNKDTDPVGTHARFTAAADAGAAPGMPCFWCSCGGLRGASKWLGGGLGGLRDGCAGLEAAGVGITEITGVRGGSAALGANVDALVPPRSPVTEMRRPRRRTGAPRHTGDAAVVLGPLSAPLGLGVPAWNANGLSAEVPAELVSSGAKA
jgi:hypothetical protein